MEIGKLWPSRKMECPLTTHCEHYCLNYKGPMRKREPTDFAKSLDKLQGVPSGDPNNAPTNLVADIIIARQKPLQDLSHQEIGTLINQKDGLPFILDLAFPLLDEDPLFDGGYYPGDVLAILIKADLDVWKERPEYRESLPELHRRALRRPHEENDMFVEVLSKTAD